ncbi:hypothetical protein TSUD_278380 [Trifolium subterraneum]|uniref:Uncharacterized protein n=1 Tax=Trifolium subterraneum TaxID=3900 RepID=A0A2Z6M8G0_TRISU|nr:hypothetical protein TSUD_278380 [Trifolium subterraneum]
MIKGGCYFNNPHQVVAAEKLEEEHRTVSRGRATERMGGKGGEASASESIIRLPWGEDSGKRNPNLGILESENGRNPRWVVVTDGGWLVLAVICVYHDFLLTRLPLELAGMREKILLLAVPEAICHDEKKP